jgi:hypothetical protein
MAKSKPAVPDTTVRVIKRANCKTLSGKSDLTYCLGDSDEELMIRIQSNDGGGFFSVEWVPISKILGVLENCNPDKPITSVVLGKLFKGKSVNTPAFLLAALKAEGVLSSIDGKQRCHELGDVEGFLARAKALQAGKPAPKEKAPAKSKAAPAKSKPAPKSKKKSI